MAPRSLPSYSLQVRAQGDRAFYDVYFRWPAGRLVKRRVGPAWVNSNGEPRRGQPRDGCFDVARGHDRAREIVAEHVASTEHLGGCSGGLEQAENYHASSGRPAFQVARR